MANTTSGTATFDKTFAIDEIVEEAFERIGQQNVAGRANCKPWWRCGLAPRNH